MFYSAFTGFQLTRCKLYLGESFINNTNFL